MSRGAPGEGRPVETEHGTFAAPWPAVLVEMQDFVDLWFLARRHRPCAVRVFISRTLVPQAQLQPHVRAFREALLGKAARLTDCRVELKGTDAAAHTIEIDYRRVSP